MKNLIMAALAASTVAGAVGVSATPAAAQPWGYWHRPYYAHWGPYRPYPYYGYAYGPGYYYGPHPYWYGYRHPYYRRFHRW
jgi:hypothetical protein